MLKLEDFKVKEIETLETTNGGRPNASIGMTETAVVFLGWIIPTGEKFDSCSACDEI